MSIKPAPVQCDLGRRPPEEATRTRASRRLGGIDPSVWLFPFLYYVVVLPIARNVPPCRRTSINDGIDSHTEYRLDQRARLPSLMRLSPVFK